MKKLIVFIVIFLWVVLLFNNTDEVRIRVIANSNSPFDQEVKMEIAKRIDNYVLKNNVTNENIKSHISGIEAILKDSNVVYSIEFTKENFPTKEINGELSHGGFYSTLLIKLGNAEGKNYFSVLYPDYYNISYEDIKTGEVEYKSWIYEQIKKLLD